MGWEWRYWCRSSRRRDAGRVKKEEESRAGCMSCIFQFHPLLFNSLQPTSESDSFFRRRRAVQRGVEAPRNSLDSDRTTASYTTASIAIEGDEFDTPITIEPARESEIAAAAVKMMKKKKVVVVLGEIEKNISSPAVTPRTSSAVARLMGLEQLPSENSTPRAHHLYWRSSSPPPPPPPLPQINIHDQKENPKKKTKKQCRREPLLRRQPLQNLNGNIEELADLMRFHDSGGSRSLPETPRIRSSWDSDAPRLSLQLNKLENSPDMREFTYLCEVSADSSPSPSTLKVVSMSCKSRKLKSRKIQLGENRSPSHCAREIVKQVKESVGKRITSRGMGSDFTDDVRVKSRLTATVPAPEKNVQRAREDPTKTRSSTPPSSSPRARFSEPLGTSKSQMRTQEQRSKPIRGPAPPPPLPSPSSSFLLKAHGDPTKKETKKMACPKCKKANSERFNERLRKPSMATLVCTSPPVTAAPAMPLRTLLHKRTEAPPKSTEANEPPSKTTQESIKTIQRSASLKATLPSPSVTTTNKSKAPPGGPELEYVRSILDRTGIRKESCVTSARWYSPAHPVDPIIFHMLELSLSESEEETNRLGPLRHRCNRKLLFHLVDEVLGDLLRPYINTKPWISADTYGRCHGEVLVKKLGSRITSFPAAECRVMEDIDLLVGGDLPEDHVRRVLLHPSVREEMESIAFEVERDLLDSLVGEAAASLALLPLRGRRSR